MHKGQLPFPAASEHYAAGSLQKRIFKSLLSFSILQSECNQETSMCMHTQMLFSSVSPL